MNHDELRAQAVEDAKLPPGWKVTDFKWVGTRTKGTWLVATAALRRLPDGTRLYVDVHPISYDRLGAAPAPGIFKRPGDLVWIEGDIWREGARARDVYVRMDDATLADVAAILDGLLPAVLLRPLPGSVPTAPADPAPSATPADAPR